MHNFHKRLNDFLKIEQLFLKLCTVDLIREPDTKEKIEKFVTYAKSLFCIFQRISRIFQIQAQKTQNWILS